MTNLIKLGKEYFEKMCPNDLHVFNGLNYQLHKGIFAIRMRKGWTQDEFASLLQEEPSHVHRLEGGAGRVYSIQTFEKAFYTLGVSYEQMEDMITLPSTENQEHDFPNASLTSIRLEWDKQYGSSEHKVRGFNKSLSQLIFILRVQKGWSQVELAEDLEMEPSMISHVESGTSDTAIKEFERILLALDVSYKDMTHMVSYDFLPEPTMEEEE